MGKAKGSQPLTAQQQRFVDAYLATHSGRLAALDAGYSPKSAATQACHLLNRPHIRRAIDFRVSHLRRRHIATADMVVKELSKLAFLDLSLLYLSLIHISEPTRPY